MAAVGKGMEGEMNMEEEEVDDSGPGFSRVRFVEVDEVLAMINNLEVICRDPTDQEVSMERLVYIMDQYQEQPQLLDPYLEKLLQALIDIARDPANSAEVKHEAFKYLYVIVKVRGYKVIVRHLPHEVSDLEPVLMLLEAQDLSIHTTWETRYVLLLWLSIICMTPFNLKSLQSTAKENDDEEVKYDISLPKRIMNICQKYVCVCDKAQDAAAYLSAKFLSRPDITDVYLTSFMEWTVKVAFKIDGVVHEQVGAMSCLALIFKLGEREKVLPFASKIMLRILGMSMRNNPSTKLRKLSIKLIQRLGLTFLPARTASWRYQQGYGSLSSNLKLGQKVCKTSTKLSMEVERRESDFSVPMEVEDVIEELLGGLKDQDTVIRWSAAKGIGRVTGRLTKALGDEVVGSVLELFSSRASPSAWHGGCLALAELGRRGLLLPERLDDVIPCILEALVYDKLQGNFSVGAHIRDAACYVCWAFARAYKPQDLKPYVQKLATALVTVTVFDREVNCRRAASAAFQENVGRQGTFPHGIDIITTADYFAVGNLRRCYLELSVHIASFPEYSESLITHLINRKMKHWDLAIRVLTSEAMHVLSDVTPIPIRGTIFQKLLDKCFSSDLNTCHCAVLCTAEVLHALALWAAKGNEHITTVISEMVMQNIARVINRWAEKPLPKNFELIMMRQAILKLIEKCALSEMPLHQYPSTVDLCGEIINANLEHTDAATRDCAVKAASAFFSQYYCDPNGMVITQYRDAIVPHYVAGLQGNKETTRCGLALALGALPLFMLVGSVPVILQGLVQCATITPGTERWVESRRDALKAITNLGKKLQIQEEDADESNVIGPKNTAIIYRILLDSLDDYTLDQRGDVGSWVREAAMWGLNDFTVAVLKVWPEMVFANFVHEMMGKLAQQALEKIDHIRDVAGQVFSNLLLSKPELPNVPERNGILKSIFTEKRCASMNWSAEKETFIMFVPLLSIEHFRYYCTLGIIQSMGGLSERLVRYSSTAMYTRFRSETPKVQLEEIQKFCATVLQIFRDYQHNDRIIISLLKMIERLFESGNLSPLTDDPETTFSIELIELISSEIRKSDKPEKMLIAIEIYCAMLEFPIEVCKRSLKQLYNLLAHKFPRIRKVTATRMYETIVDDKDAKLVAARYRETATALLLSTDWNKKPSELRAVRNELKGILVLSEQ